jgi:hypothetical protein
LAGYIIRVALTELDPLILDVATLCVALFGARGCMPLMRAQAAGFHEIGSDVPQASASTQDFGPANLP